MNPTQEITQWFMDLKQRYRAVVMEAAFKGFVLYLVPVALLSRKLQNETLRRATAVAAFASVTRVLHQIMIDRRKELEKRLLGEATTPPVSPGRSDSDSDEDERHASTAGTSGTARRPTGDAMVATRRPVPTRLRSQSVTHGLVLLREICKDLLDVGSHYPRFWSAAAGTVAALLIDSGFVSSIFVLWCAIRAVRTSIPEQYCFRGGAPLVMYLATAQLIPTWMMSPDEIDKGYRKFLDFQGGIPRDIMKELATSHPVNACELLHPNRPCNKFLGDFFIKGIGRAVKMYAVLHSVMFVLSSKRSLRTLAQNITTSTLFLALYCTIAWASLCARSKLLPIRTTRLSLLMHVPFCSLTVLLERSNRQSDLAAYCATYAVDSMLKGLQKRKLLPTFPGIATFVLILSAAVMAQNHKQQAPLLSRWLLGFADE